MLKDLQGDVKKLTNKEKALLLQRFFKTGVGEYGEGDVFAGLTVPQSRQIAKKYSSLNLKELQVLLNSKIHEERLISLLILINKYKVANHKKIIFHFYLKNTKNINNWDLVDLSAPNIVGEHLLNNNQIRVKLNDKNFLATPFEILKSLAKSQSLWERRISVISTFAFIREKKFDTSLKIAEILINDKEDLIQKALGWMLREIGNRDLIQEEAFLKKNYKKMGRTALRYAIEKFPEEKRQKYLKGKI